jgi:hypothetical protein
MTAGTNTGWKQDNGLWTSGSLTPNTTYTFRARSRNGDTVETAYSATATKTTLAAAPGTASFTNAATTQIRAAWTAGGNPAGTQFTCENTTAGTSSGWTTALYWDSAALTCGTTYAFRVKARNADGVETAWTSLGSQATSVCPDTTPPPGPIALAVTPGSWTSVNSFATTWTNPSDPSGIAAAWYKLGSPPASPADGIRVPGTGIHSLSGLSVSSEGTTPLYVWLEDGAGNTSTLNRASVTIKYRSGRPSKGKIRIDGGASTTLSLSANLDSLEADDLAGISRMQFSNSSGGPWSSPEPYSSSKTGWDLSAYGGDTGPGPKTVFVRFENAAGLWSDPAFGSIYYQAPQAFPFADDFSTDKGWFGYGAGGWERGPVAVGGGENGYPDPALDHSHTGDNHVLGFVLGGDYTAFPAESSIVSPPIDCSGQEQVFLKFWRFLNVEAAPAVSARIDVSTDEVVWVPLWENPSEDLMDKEWTRLVYDISPLAAGQSTVYVRFTLGPVDSSRRFSGWNIDDLEVTSGYAISGAVADTSGIPVEGVTVCFTDSKGQQVKPCVETDALGYYIQYGFDAYDRKLKNEVNVTPGQTGPKVTPKKTTVRVKNDDLTVNFRAKLPASRKR